MPSTIVPGLLVQNSSTFLITGAALLAQEKWQMILSGQVKKNT